MKKNKTQTQTKESILEELNQKFASDFLNDGKNALSTKVENKEIVDIDITENKMTTGEIHRKLHNVMMNPRNRNKFMNLKPIDFSTIPNEFYDEEGQKVNPAQLDPETPPPSTLPAVISKELRSTGVLDIKWVSTKDLPRGQDRDIRALAKAVFSAFDIDDKADVVCINSFKDNDFLNEPREVNAVLGYLEKYASSPHLGVMKQDFGSTIKGYEPEIKLYHTPTMAYLAVNEPEGHGLEANYIYAFKRKVDFKLENVKKQKISHTKNKP